LYQDADISNVFENIARPVGRGVIDDDDSPFGCRSTQRI
jgi:hypothetical protein